MINLEKLKESFNSKWLAEPNTGCWLWLAGVDKDGYGQFYVGRQADTCKMRRAHRFSYELHISEISAGMFVLHRCDTPACVNPEHLFLGLAADNTRDMIEKGRVSHGESRHNAVLTKSDVYSIREDDRVHRVIAAEYGVSRAVVTRIKLGTRWAHI